ncbi:MAG: efflux RND transporter permease subunit [Bryobacterales bacterium]|nr:efflux RND transporter permease subunit [Bryobacterales bacterium]
MLERLVRFHLENRWLVLVGLFVFIGVGIRALNDVAIEAFPDLTPNQVTIVTSAPAMAPDEVADLVTYPMESAVMGLTHAEGVRSISKLGLSMVTIVFDDSVNIYFARQIVNERIQEAKGRMPAGLEPTLGPVATAFGEVYQYTVEGEGRSTMDLKTIHEWMVKNQLRGIAGVNEVNTWGGETQQYQIVIDPVRLQAYGLTLGDVYRRIAANNENFGGGYIEHAYEQYTVRGLGRARGIPDLENIVLLSSRGSSVAVKDVGRVELGPMPRQGAVTRDGLGERVSGMVIMLKGENGKRVIERVKEKIASLHLPEGVSLRPFYDQSTVIDSTIATVRRNLLGRPAGSGYSVAFQCGPLIVAAVIPFSLLFGFIGMMAFGISANLMSLGAIDFGMMVDGSVVMMENAVRHLQRDPEDREFDAVRIVRATSTEVARPIVFAVAIIIAVYLPILTLEGLEGRMFRPMAITVCSALLGSLILALTVVPAAASVFLRNGVKEHAEHRFDRVRAVYRRILQWAFTYRIPVLGTALAILITAVTSLGFIGTEFMPRLDEGSILLQTLKLPGISLSESVKLSGQVETVMREFPEVTSVVSKIGRPDFATEAMGIYEADVYILLKPREVDDSAHQDGSPTMEQRLKVISGVHFNLRSPWPCVSMERSGTRATSLCGRGDDAAIDSLPTCSADCQRVHGAADAQRK